MTTATKKERNSEIATEILRQMGGKRFSVMTGSKNFMATERGLIMNLARNASGCNRLEITLTGNDDYTLEFYKVSISRKTYDVKIQNKQIFQGVYCDQLQQIFTQVTGLYTRL